MNFSLPLDPDLLDLWVRERSPEPASIHAMQGVVRSFVHHTGCNRLDHIQREMFLLWKERLFAAGCGVVTWNTYLRSMRVLLRLAGYWGWDGGRMIRGIKTLPVRTKRKKTVDDFAIQAAIRWLESPQQFQVNPGWFWVHVIRTLYYTGIRRRQLVGLSWGDVNLKSGTLHLSSAHSKTRRGWDIPLPAPLLPVLTSQQQRTEAALQRSIRLTDQVFNVTVFTGRWKGDQTTVHHISSALRRISDNAGVKISAHRFRHTFA
ncbi:MAG: site-specific integrase, partial [Thiothrix sp.]|nr:site-specific integrase [Thiothrix sp.]